MEMRAVNLLVKPFQFVSYLELKCVKELNQHGVMRITGMIRKENQEEYMEMASQKLWVSVEAISENEEIRHFFSGILTGLWMKKEGQVYLMTIEVKTGSFLLDIKPHIRSFQEAGILYSEVINTCMKAAEGICSMQEKENEVTEQFILQYKETDWEFMKRLASYAGVVLIPEDGVSAKKLYWGCQKSDVIRKIQTDSYQTEQDYEWYEEKKVAETENLKWFDAVNYIFESREIYNLGETVQFNGMNLVVGKIESWLEGQELYHSYRLMTKAGGMLMPIYNNIHGISLKAMVLEVERTMVKIQIEEDENKAGCRNCWLDYATVYSTPDGTGWYCMPEVGDEVRMVIPDNNEGHAYVASSVHLGASGGRVNPDEKSWKNRQNKEILFTPSSIILRNNNGMSMELSDQEGIKIISDKDITVQSDKNIQIKSKGAGVNMSADGNIQMQQGAAMIQIKDDINIGGGKIYMN